jgi:hypothetical protein
MFFTRISRLLRTGGSKPEKTLEIITPVHPQPRYRCPFYGFHSTVGVMMDQKGNGCGLITGSHSPCQMEIYINVPNWNNCSLNKGEDLSELDNRLRVFPGEFWPKGIESWKGLTFGQWRRHVMDERTVRPS